MRGHAWLAGCSVGRDVRVTGPILVRGSGTVVIGDGAVLDAARMPIELHAFRDGRLEIAPGAVLGPGVSIEAASHVEVGRGTRLGPYAKLLDNSWHSTSGDRAAVPESVPIRIGAGCRVGARSTVLPGGELADEGILPDNAVLTRSGAVIRPDRDPRSWGLPAPAPGARGRQGLPPLFPLIGAWATPTSARSLLAIAGVAGVARVMPTSRGEHLGAYAERWTGHARARWTLRRLDADLRTLVTGPVDIRNRGRILMGRGSGFGGGPARSRVQVGPGAELRIGDRTLFNYAVHVHVEDQMTFGTDCLIGSQVLLVDRLGERRGPITVGDEVWLAHGATVLPGVTIGSGSVVAAATVVDRDVPPQSMAYGAPMRIRSLVARSR